MSPANARTRNIAAPDGPAAHGPVETPLVELCRDALAGFEAGGEFHDAPRGPLLRQLLLHLRRFDDADLTRAQVERERDRLAERLVRRLDDLPAGLRGPAAPAELRRATLRPVDASVSTLIHHAYHYLGSAREDGLHLGLRPDDASSARPLSAVTLSPFDLSHLEAALPNGVRPEQVLVLSRLFAFDGAPRHTASFTLGRVFSWLREHRPHVRLLLTYLNPGLGFRGAVYRATNWTLFGREAKGRYLYLDSDYLTDRRAIRQFGTADLQRLRLLLGGRVTASAPPPPLEIYAYPLDRGLSRDLSRRASDLFAPPAALVGGA